MEPPVGSERGAGLDMMNLSSHPLNNPRTYGQQGSETAASQQAALMTRVLRNRVGVLHLGRLLLNTRVITSTPPKIL